MNKLTVGLLVNNMVYMSDLIKNVKVGQPLGKDNEGVPQPSTVEAGESEMSLSHIRSNIQAMQNVFNGIGVLEDLKGFDDMLNSMEVKSGNVLLSDRINAQFNAINQTLDEIQVPLQEAVVSSPAKVDELYREMKDLLLLIKVDMVSNLGVVLTISDNDGD